MVAVSNRFKRGPTAAHAVRGTLFRRAAVGRMTLNSVLADRLSMIVDADLGGSGGLDRPGRDLNRECGYPRNPTVKTFTRLYAREGYAARVVNIFPDECWAVYPGLYETEDSRKTKFERAWDKLNRRVLCWHYLHRADRLSGVGQFGVILLGLSDGRSLDKPVRGLNRLGEKSTKSRENPGKPVRLLYIRVFSEESVQIDELDSDENSPRFGQPVFYEIIVSDPTTRGSGTTTKTLRVHWTRVIHVADMRESSEVYGVPRMQPVVNRLFDIRKVLGGSAEMFWKGAFPGYSIETVPELLGESQITEDTVREQMLEYEQGLKRYLAFDGVTVKPLTPQVADPSAHVREQVTAVCSALGVPIRIFLGTEAAHLASTQDAGTWNRRIAARQQLYLEPLLIRPFVDRLIAVGVLPEPREDYIISWRDLNTISDTDKANVALKKAQALMTFVSGKCEQAMTVKTFFVSILGMTPEEADAAVTERQASQSMMTDPLGVKAAKAADRTSKVVGGNGRVKPQGGGRVGNPPRADVGRPAGNLPSLSA